MKPEGDEDLGFDLPEPARIGRGKMVVIGLTALAALGLAFRLGWWPRHRAQEALAAETIGLETDKRRVEVVSAKVASSDRAITLPGSVQPLQETVIYPRTSGYVRSWNVDLGDKVKEGALLAVIDAPEVDQQLAQARAQLGQAEAALVQAEAAAAFSKANAERYERLAPAGVASQQDLEKERSQAAVDQANVLVARSNVAAQKANIDRLAQLQSFSRVTAPFAGTITSRSIDRGALVTAGNGTPLFKIADSETVRVFVQVPQDVASGVKVDQPAKVSVREFAGRAFEGKVSHAAGALDGQTRTMSAEVRIPNPKGELLAGMYALVSLTLPTPHRVFEIPATALLTDAKGVRVATVTAEDTIRLVPVVVERDTGATIEIASGLSGDERIVRQASADLFDGRSVEVKK